MQGYITGKKFIFYSIALFMVICIIIVFAFYSKQLKGIIIISTENITDKVFFTKKSQSFSVEFNKEILSDSKFLKMEEYGGNFFDLEITGLGKQNPFALPIPIKSTDGGNEESKDNLSSSTTTEFLDNL